MRVFRSLSAAPRTNLTKAGAIESRPGRTATDSQNRRCTLWRDGVGTEYLALDFPRTIRFGNEFVKRGYLSVPFHARRYRAEPSHGLALKRPTRSCHSLILRIDHQASLPARTC